MSIARSNPRFEVGFLDALHRIWRHSCQRYLGPHYPNGEASRVDQEPHDLGRRFHDPRHDQAWCGHLLPYHGICQPEWMLIRLNLLLHPSIGDLERRILDSPWACDCQSPAHTARGTGGAGDAGGADGRSLHVAELAINHSGAVSHGIGPWRHMKTSMKTHRKFTRKGGSTEKGRSGSESLLLV